MANKKKCMCRIRVKSDENKILLFSKQRGGKLKIMYMDSCTMYMLLATIMWYQRGPIQLSKSNFFRNNSLARSVYS